jgi:hypothetical protein
MTSGIPTKIKRKVIGRSGTVTATVTLSDFLASLDFGDYKNVILHPPNWRLIFSNHLKEQKTVVARLTELNRYRRSVAHSRRISETEFASLEASVKLLTREFRLKRSH